MEGARCYALLLSPQSRTAARLPERKEVGRHPSRRGPPEPPAHAHPARTRSPPGPPPWTPPVPRPRRRPGPPRHMKNTKSEETNSTSTVAYHAHQPGGKHKSAKQTPAPATYDL